MDGINNSGGPPPFLSEFEPESVVPPDELIFNPVPEGAPEGGPVIEPEWHPPVDWCGTGTGLGAPTCRPASPAAFPRIPNVTNPFPGGFAGTFGGGGTEVFGPDVFGGPQVVVNPVPEATPGIDNVLEGLRDNEKFDEASLTPNASGVGLRSVDE